MNEILSIGELLDLGNSASTAGLIPYSALEYNGSGNISAISGSAIAGGVESSVVSSIVSSMVSSKADQSAVDDCCSAMSAVVSGKMDASASGNFAPSGDYAYNSSLSSYIPQSSSGQFAPSGDYAYNSGLSSYVAYSAISGDSGNITSINGSAISAGSEFNGVYTDATLSGSGLSASPLGVVNLELEFDPATLTRTLSGRTATVSVNSSYTIPVQAVSSSAEATASNILYIVTGEGA
jgi:hypothetical protein